MGLVSNSLSLWRTHIFLPRIQWTAKAIYNKSQMKCSLSLIGASAERNETTKWIKQAITNWITLHIWNCTRLSAVHFLLSCWLLAWALSTYMDMGMLCCASTRTTKSVAFENERWTRSEKRKCQISQLRKRKKKKNICMLRTYANWTFYHYIECIGIGCHTS